MTRQPPRSSAFTLVEMLVVMAVIAILTGLILGLNGMVQNTGARARAGAEIKALSAACEAYKADNGGYPQSSTLTDTPDPRSDGNPADYQKASLFLWQQLSGHTNGTSDTNTTTVPTGTNYAADFFKSTVLSGTKNGNNQVTLVSYIMDPFGNSYCYSTAGLLAEQNYRAQVLTNGSGTRVIAGYNSTFDLWSTVGGTTTATNAKWVKNW